MEPFTAGRDYPSVTAAFVIAVVVALAAAVYEVVVVVGMIMLMIIIIVRVTCSRRGILDRQCLVPIF